VGELLCDRPAVRIAHDGSALETGFRHYGVEIGGERGHVVGSADLVALPVSAQVRNQHPDPVAEEFDERIEHRTGDHRTVQQKQRFAFPFDPEEDAV